MASASSRVGCPHCGEPLELQLEVTEGELTVDASTTLMKIVVDRDALRHEVARHAKVHH